MVHVIWYLEDNLFPKCSVHHNAISKLVLSIHTVFVQITIPALRRDIWCAFFCDSKLKVVRVIDPLYKDEQHNCFDKVHKPNMQNLQSGFVRVFREFFEQWNQHNENWGISYVKPLLQNTEK